MANAKGYTLKLTATEVTVDGGETKCTMSALLFRYPAETLVGTGGGGSAKASGTGKQAILDCVEAITESQIKKASRS
jgi:hypothetical protein